MPQTTLGTWNVVLLIAVVAVLALPYRSTWASEESVDDATKMALTLDLHPNHGKVLFQQQCAACHGAGAQGNPSQHIPALGGQRFAYLVRQLANFAGDERESKAMHRTLANEHVREPQAWADLAGYLNRLPVVRVPESGNGTDMAIGRRIYQEHCTSCHYADAHGDEDGFVPSLRRQHYGYLVSQIHQLRQSARHNVDKELVLSIGNLTEADTCAVADYLSRLRGPTKNRQTMRVDGTVVD